MIRISILVAFLALVCLSCSEDDNINNTLVVDGQKFQLDRLYCRSTIASNHSQFLLVACSRNGSLSPAEVAGDDILGTQVNYIRFFFNRNEETNEPITGTFAQDLVQMIAAADYNSDNSSGVRFSNFSPGTVTIKKKGSQYTIKFSGISNDVKISATYTGPLIVLPDIIEQ